MFTVTVWRFCIERLKEKFWQKKQLVLYWSCWNIRHISSTTIVSVHWGLHEARPLIASYHRNTYQVYSGPNWLLGRYLYTSASLIFLLADLTSGNQRIGLGLAARGLRSRPAPIGQWRAWRHAGRRGVERGGGGAIMAWLPFPWDGGYILYYISWSTGATIRALLKNGCMVIPRVDFI